MVRPLVSHALGREPAEFFVCTRQQMLGSARLAAWRGIQGRRIVRHLLVFPG
jgi:hypothetical protein